MHDGVLQPFQLLPIFQERVWGKQSLAPYYGSLKSERQIGEVWFSSDRNPTSLGETLGELVEHHPEVLGEAADPSHPNLCPLLVKLLFTTERLSVQVHPDDLYAARHHRSLGKTEAWYVLSAEPNAKIAIGFRHEITSERLRKSAETGEIEGLLDWRRVRAGDVVYVPAGTVHALGAGLTVCEIQQNSDITYRLYDYGRPRELHLDHGCKVSKLIRHEHHAAPYAIEPWRDHLVDCEYFRIERLTPDSPVEIGSGLPYYLLLICVQGSGSINGKAAEAGQTWVVPAGGDRCRIDAPGSEWILAYTAKEALPALRSS